MKANAEFQPLYSTYAINEAKQTRRTIRTEGPMAKAKTIPFRDLTAKLMKNPEFAAEYERLGPEFELAEKLIRARKSAGLTQAELAERMHTTQSAIARMESGTLPARFDTLQRYAEATGNRLEIAFVAKSEPAKAEPAPAPTPATVKIEPAAPAEPARVPSVEEPKISAPVTTRRRARGMTP
jgi:transcriptional regulator with XRE-family HTH domain